MNDFLTKLADLNLVIFDLDGTLIDSNGMHNELDIELVRSFGETKSAEEMAAGNYDVKFEGKGYSEIQCLASTRK